MAFGEFYTAVCVDLRVNFGWSQPGKMLETEPGLVNGIHDEWVRAMQLGTKSVQYWPDVVSGAADLVGGVLERR